MRGHVPPSLWIPFEFTLIWPLCKTRLSTLWQKPRWQSQRSDLSCSWSAGLHTSQEGFCPTPLCRSSVIMVSKLMFGNFESFSYLHRVSMGLRSGDWLGHSRTLMCFFLTHSFVALALYFGSLSCWNTHPWPIFNALALTVHGPVHSPFNAVQLSCPLSRTPPQSIMFPPPCLIVGIVFLGPQTAFLLLQTRWVDTKELDFGLIWPQHFHSVLFWIIGKLQTSLYMCFFEQGDLRVLQDFSPSRRSVLPIVFLVTFVLAALRSLTRSSRVVLGWFLTVQCFMIIETPQGEILLGAPDRGRLTVSLCFFHTPAVVTFSPSSLAMVVLPIPVLCRSTTLFLTSLDSSLVLVVVESLFAGELPVSASDVTMHMAHLSGNTCVECRSLCRIGWIIQDFRETCVLCSLTFRLEIKMPWRQTPSRKKNAVMFTNVMTNAYQDQINAGFF